MDGEAVDVCKLVVADLLTRVNTFAVTGWTPRRAFVPQFKLKDIKDVQVVVCHASRTGERENRGRVVREIGIYVGVLKLLDSTSSDQAASEEDLAELDGLVLLMEQLQQLFVPEETPPDEPPTPYVVGTNGKYLATEAAAVPLYSIEDMKERRQFTGVLSVKFRAA